MKVTPYIIHEHSPLPDNLQSKDSQIYKDNPLLELTNFGTQAWQWKAYFRIGVQWLGDSKDAIAVTPKEGVQHIDFVQMFLSCLNSGLDIKGFSDIYDIQFDQSPIHAPQMNNVLAPLIIVHFLTMVKRIIAKGLKKGYVHREENLKKVKGRIRIFTNERKNIIPHRFDHVFCQYNEFTADIPENRLIKKALLFVENIVHQFSKHQYYTNLVQLLGQCRVAFTEVNPEVEIRDVKQSKCHKLFREYAIAIDLAKKILYRFNYMLKESNEHQSTPPFWIDMSKLYEMYVYSLLSKDYGNAITYQVKGTSQQTPDFLFVQGEQRYILDAKYMPQIENGHIGYEVARQLSGYARDKVILKKLGYNDESVMNKTVVPCIVIYPDPNAKFSQDDKTKKLLEYWEKEPNWTQFHKLAVPIPTTGDGD